MSSYVSFRVVKVLNSYRERACRAAMMSLCKARLSTTEGLYVQTKAIRRLKCYRLDTLKQAGWPLVADNYQLVCMLNCPPSGLMVRPVGKDKLVCRPCQRPLVCPFCYARRWVRSGFSQMEDALFAKGKLKPRQDGALFSFVNRVIVPLKNAPTAEVLAAVAAAWKKKVMQNRRMEIDAWSPSAGVIFHRFDMTQEGIVASRSGVVFTDGSSPVELPNVAVEDHQLTRRGLAASFARAFRFPAGFFRLPAEQFLAVINALGRVRMMEAYGLARTSKAKGRTHENQEASGA